MANFSEILTDLIIEADITNAFLAEKIGVSTATVSNWKNNNHGIELRSLVALCKYFNCSLDYLAGRTEHDKKPSKYEIENFGKHVRKVMRSKGKTTYTLRKNTKFGSKYFYDWDRGTEPKLNTLIELANYFDCSLDELVGFE